MTNDSKTSTPRYSASSKTKKSESLTAKVKNWIGKPGILRTKNANVEDAIEVIEKSFNAMYLNDANHLEEEEEKKESEEGAKAKADEEVIDLTSQSNLEQRYTSVMIDTFKVITSKDAQIDTLEHYLSIREATITPLQDMNKDIVGKVDDLMSFHTQKIDKILAKIENSERRKQNEEMASTMVKLSEFMDRTSTNTVNGQKNWQVHVLRMERQMKWTRNGRRNPRISC